jgi:hypothetical protein
LYFFSFTSSLCASKYMHLIEPKVEGQKVASHGGEEKKSYDDMVHYFMLY